MLHTETITHDELTMIQVRNYAVMKPETNRAIGDGIVFTVKDTRIQLQAVITEINPIFKSKHIVSLDHVQVSGVEAVDDLKGTGVGDGPGAGLKAGYANNEQH